MVAVKHWLCIICHADAPGFFCDACGRSYDRSAHDEGTVIEAMAWAANRAVRLRAAARRTNCGIVAIKFDADELVMLRDRVSAGAEISEEDGWSELLDKIEAAQQLLKERAP